MEVTAPGTKVRIGGDVEAVVLAVCIRSAGPTFEVAWWNGKTRSTAWVEPHEIVVTDETPSLRIGFVS